MRTHHCDLPSLPQTAMRAAHADEDALADSDPPPRPYSLPLPVSTELHLLRHMLDAWREQTTQAFTVEPRSGHIQYAHRVTLTHLSDEAVIAAMRDFTALANLAADVRTFNRTFGTHEARRGRCVQSLCACLASILDRYDLMLLPFDNELRRQTCALAAGMPFMPVVDSRPTSGDAPADSSRIPALGNVPLTLLSFQQYLAPFIPQMILLGDVVHRAAPHLYDDSHHTKDDEDTAAPAPAAPSAASLLTLLHQSLDLHSLLCSASQSSLLFCLFLTTLLPYLEYLDEFTVKGSLHPRAEEDGFFIQRRVKPQVPRVQMPDGEDEEQVAEGQESVGEEFELRLDPSSGAVVAPSFLQPYAQHILLTGRSRAMVHSIRRLMRAAADASEERVGARRGRATIRAAAPAVVDPFAFAQTNEQANLFRSFHEGLAMMFHQRAPTAAAAAADSTRAAAAAAPSNDLGHAFAAVARAADDSKEAEEDAAYDDDTLSDAESAAASSEAGENSDVDASAQSEENHSQPGSAASSAPSSPSARARSKKSRYPPPMLALESGPHDVSSTALVVAASSSTAAAAPGSTSVSVPRAPLRELTPDERAALSIFMDVPADFDNVHSMFKPPPALTEEDDSGTKQQSTGQNSKQGAQEEATTERNAATASSPPPAAPPAPFVWPRPLYTPSLRSSSVASFFSPVMLHNEWTVAAAADAMRGAMPSSFGAAEQSGEELDTAAAVGAGSSTKLPRQATTVATPPSSAFLSSYPLSSSLLSLQRFVDLLLFHAHFPPDSLHGVVGDCLIEPLRERYQAATQQFSQQITEQCEFNHVRQRNTSSCG